MSIARFNLAKTHFMPQSKLFSGCKVITLMIYGLLTWQLEASIKASQKKMGFQSLSAWIEMWVDLLTKVFHTCNAQSTYNV